MVRLFDANGEYDMESVVEALDAGGIVYSVTSLNGTIKEISVAEEDVPKAEELMFLATKRRFCTFNG